MANANAGNGKRHDRDRAMRDQLPHYLLPEVRVRVNSSKQSSLIISLLAAIVFAVASMPAITAASAYDLRGRRFAQDDAPSDEDNIPSEQVDKYIAVYSAMQKNHSLSVEQAASRQGLTVDEFRTLEDKIERNPVVHERVLAALKKQTAGSKAGTGSASH